MKLRKMKKKNFSYFVFFFGCRICEWESGMRQKRKKWRKKGCEVKYDSQSVCERQRERENERWESWMYELLRYQRWNVVRDSFRKFKDMSKERKFHLLLLLVVTSPSEDAAVFADAAALLFAIVGQLLSPTLLDVNTEHNFFFSLTISTN